jgi:hypothetical protein
MWRALFGGTVSLAANLAHVHVVSPVAARNRAAGAAPIGRDSGGSVLVIPITTTKERFA